jgi:hypothetical protein
VQDGLDSQTHPQDASQGCKAFCFVQKAWGRAHVTHNTPDCRKYNKDGKIKKSFGKGQRSSTASNKMTASVFAELSAKVVKVEKANKKLKKVHVSTSTITTATPMTPTPLDGADPVALGGTTVEKIKLTTNLQLSKNTTPYPIKAASHSISKVNLNIINTDAPSNPFHKSLTANNKNSDLNNTTTSENVYFHQLKNILQQK